MIAAKAIKIIHFVYDLLILLINKKCLMAISANSLFHYSDNFDTIEKILQTGFKLSYCLESEMAFPMISFCDAPLGQAGAFFDKYGKYAIGMNYVWGRKHKLNPVIYLDDGSILAMRYRNSKIGISNYIKSILGEEIVDIDPQLDEVFKLILELNRYSKPYKGVLERQDRTIPDYKFYDEREWRYVSDLRSTEIAPALTREDYIEFKSKNPTKPHFESNGLNFIADDIKYIIVKDEIEIFKLIEILEDYSHLGSPKQIRLLTTRIISTRQILEDF